MSNSLGSRQLKVMVCQSLDQAISAMLQGCFVPWCEMLADRRIELIEQKRHSALSESDETELALLQEAFGRHQWSGTIGPNEALCTEHQTQ